MKSKIVLSIAVIAMVQLILVGKAPEVKATPIQGLYNTGVDDVGNVQTIGTAEAHYVMTGVSSGAKVITPGWFWAAAPAGSAWIGPSSGLTSDPLGDWFYTLSFDMTGLIASTAQISGDWVTDDSSELRFNGTLIATETNAVWASFAINTGFLAGQNTLQWKVTNLFGTVSNPTGLLVANLTGSAAPVPEPATIALLGIGLVGLAGAEVRRRRKKKAVD